MIPDKLITTVSGYNGVQVSFEAKYGDEWKYLAIGFNHGLRITYGEATPDDVSDTLRTLATARGEENARYAASNREHCRDIIDWRSI